MVGNLLNKVHVSFLSMGTVFRPIRTDENRRYVESHLANLDNTAQMRPEVNMIMVRNIGVRLCRVPDCFVKLLMLLFCLTWLASACDSADKDQPEAADVPRPVKTLQLQPSDSLPTLSFPAVIRSAERAELAFNIPGVLTELPVLEGQVVARGTVLARLDARDVQNRLLADQAAYDLARTNYERAQTLAEQEIIAKAELEQLRAAYEQARAALAVSRKGQDDTVLRAPFEGVVSKRYVNNFQNVQAKQPIVLFQSSDRLEVVVQIPEPLVLRSVQEEDASDTVRIRFEARPDLPIPATFKEISTEADPRTQTFQVVFTMNPPGELLVLPGMTATLVAERGAVAERPIFVLPPAALATDDAGRPLVWIFDAAAGQARSRAVTLGAVRPDGVEVLEGLATGETLITTGLSQLYEGRPVRPLQP
jgi:membrane fusion protein, multidrug efflux system